MNPHPALNSVQITHPDPEAQAHHNIDSTLNPETQETSCLQLPAWFHCLQDNRPHQKGSVQLVHHWHLTGLLPGNRRIRWAGPEHINEKKEQQNCCFSLVHSITAVDTVFAQFHWGFHQITACKLLVVTGRPVQERSCHGGRFPFPGTQQVFKKYQSGNGNQSGNEDLGDPQVEVDFR